MAKYFIVGFMGSGKSTILQKLKKIEILTGFNFLDLDEVIEKNQKMKIGNIVNQNGLQYFRELEIEQISLILSSSDNCIVSLGGGALHDKSLDLITKNDGKIIWMNTSFSICLDRIRAGGNIRPLNSLSDNELFELYESRCKFYKKAQLTIIDEIEKLLQFITSSTI